MSQLDQATARRIVANLSAPPRHEHGCRNDKACTDATCIELPAGKTCGHCVHERRCVLMFGHKPSDTYCDWFPRRFHEKPAAAVEAAPAKEFLTMADATTDDNANCADPTEGPSPIAWMRRHPDGTWADEMLPNWQMEPIRKCSGAWVPLYERAVPATNFKQAAEQIGDGLVAAYEADPREAIALITGLFVGLLEDAIRRGGGDPDRQIKINSEGERDITVHVRGVPATAGEGSQCSA